MLDREIHLVRNSMIQKLAGWRDVEMRCYFCDSRLGYVASV
jgi:hypothetical protein